MPVCRPHPPSSIVGYSQSSTRQNAKGIGAQFVAVAGDGIDLTDIKVVGYEELAEGDVTVQTLSPLGKTVKMYYWYDLPEDDLYGWLDGSDEPAQPGDLVLAPGQALWVVAPDDTTSLQTAGQVMTKSLAVILHQNAQLLANNTPIDVDLTEITVEGDGVAEGDLTVQTLSPLGKTEAMYYWYDLPEDDLYGWLDGSDNPVEEGDLILAPGETLWVNSPVNGARIIFPGVSL